MIMVVSALANLLLNIEPSQATTPSFLPNFGMQERRENVREMNLARIAEIAAREIEILRHHAECEIFRRPECAAPAAGFPRREHRSRCCACRCSRRRAASALSPGFHGWPAPSIHSNLFSSIRPLTQASSTQVHHRRTILRACQSAAPIGSRLGALRRASRDIDMRNYFRG